MPIHAVAVFCGSQQGSNKQYQKEAEALGELLAERSIELIYGGGRNGLMGYIADAVLKSGGIVRGVMPQGLAATERSHTNIFELIVVEGMHERKRRMYELCDAAVVLPGGFGTLDELFEMLTWNHLALHHKKVFLLNTSGFYNHLLQHMQLASTEGFLYGDLRKQITVLSAAADFKAHLP